MVYNHGKPMPHTAGEEMFTAGEKVPAGSYLDVDSLREVIFEHEGVLPAACNGKSGLYVRRAPTWAEITNSVSGG
jgi:hypothetical protein